MFHVFVSAWEQQCCGEEFALGSHISWGVGEGDWRDRDPLGGYRPEGMLFEAHHHESAERLVGTVTALQNVFFRYDENRAARAWSPITGSAVLEPVTRADPWVRDRGEMTDGALQFVGYLVEVDGTLGPTPRRRTKAGPRSRS